MFKTGDTVTCKAAVTAYYSEYAGLPKQDFAPGMVGTVVNPKSPKVRRMHGGSPFSIIVAFEGTAYGPNHARYTTWRVALDVSNTVKVN